MELNPENGGEQAPIDYNAVRIQLKAKQDWYFALAGGLTAAIFSAAIWALVTVLTKYQIGYMAIAAGLASGFAVQWFGAGVTLPYRLIGLVAGLMACALGNLLSQLAFISVDENMSFLKTLSYYPWSRMGTLFIDSFSPIDVLFYALAGYTGFKYGARELTDDFLNVVSQDPSVADYKYQQFRLPLAAVSVFMLLGGGLYLSQGYTGKKEYTYDSGKLMSEGEVVKNIQHGAWTFYFENGGVSAKGFFEKGKRSGDWIFFSEDSSLTEFTSYKNGFADGLSKSISFDGTVVDSTWYEKGVANGFTIERFPGGALKLSGLLHLGSRSGYWKFGSENGIIVEEGVYFRGAKTGIWTTRYENGKLNREMRHTDSLVYIVHANTEHGIEMVKNGKGVLKEEGYYTGMIAEGPVVDGLRHGDWIDRYVDGSGSIHFYYQKGQRKVVSASDPTGAALLSGGNGTLTIFENGFQRLVVSVIDSLFEGDAKILYDDGTLSETITYKNGKRDGPYVSYNTSGVVIETGRFSKNKKDGLWTTFLDDGILKSSEVNYLNGKFHGESIGFNDSGVPIRVRNYEMDSVVAIRLTGE